MARERVNPFDQGTAERVLFDRYRKATHRAEILEREAALSCTAAKAERASAGKYADALRALGHGDVVPGQEKLPDYSQLGPDDDEVMR